MKLIADALIDLPFKLDLCARGPDIEPLTCEIGGFAATVYFPPSLGDGTDGQGIFGEWAWWTGKTLRVVLEREIATETDEETLRREALDAGNDLLRRLLNACRWRLGRPDIHPITLDPRALSLEILHDDGRREALAEPFSAFFYQTMPKEPPLATTLNVQTLETIGADVRDGVAPPLAEQLRLDAEALERQGAEDRATLVRGLIAGIISAS